MNRASTASKLNIWLKWQRCVFSQFLNCRHPKWWVYCRLPWHFSLSLSLTHRHYRVFLRFQSHVKYFLHFHITIQVTLKVVKFFSFFSLFLSCFGFLSHPCHTNAFGNNETRTEPGKKTHFVASADIEFVKAVIYAQSNWLGVFPHLYH